MAQIVQARAAGIGPGLRASLPAKLGEGLAQCVVGDPGAALGREEAPAEGVQRRSHNAA